MSLQLVCGDHDSFGIHPASYLGRSKPDSSYLHGENVTIAYFVVFLALHQAIATPRNDLSFPLTMPKSSHSDDSDVLN